jgi:hypothetical protein
MALSLGVVNNLAAEFRLRYAPSVMDGVFKTWLILRLPGGGGNLSQHSNVWNLDAS